MFTSIGSKGPASSTWDEGLDLILDTEPIDERKEQAEEPPRLTCGYTGCTLDALWRQYDPPDRRFPRYICTHHRSYMLIRNPEAVLLYGWVGLFPEGRNRRRATGSG